MLRWLTSLPRTSGALAMMAVFGALRRVNLGGSGVRLAAGWRRYVTRRELMSMTTDPPAPEPTGTSREEPRLTQRDKRYRGFS
jgi:hypothetical protein